MSVSSRRLLSSSVHGKQRLSTQYKSVMGHRVATGVTEIPNVGLGSLSVNGSECADSVHAALDAGFRHFDTANMYGNEEIIGKTIRESSLERGELFITSKFWPTTESQEEVQAMIEKSVSFLGGLDLLLIHFPAILPHLRETEKRNGRWYGDFVATAEQVNTWRQETWQTMEKYVREGSVKHLGVSNFQKAHLQHILSFCSVAPSANQIELHCLNHKLELETINFCRANEIVVEAYCPLRQADSQLLDHTTVQLLGTLHKKTPAQVLLRWAVQKGFVVLPKSTNQRRIQENISIFDFELSDSEMVLLDDIGDTVPEDQRKLLWDSREMRVL